LAKGYEGINEILISQLNKPAHCSDIFKELREINSSCLLT